METTTKNFIIGQAVIWSKDSKNFEGIVRDDFGKDAVEVMCVMIDERRACQKMNVKRDLLTKKNKKMSDVKKILLKGKFKKLNKKQLLVKIEDGKLNELEVEVVNELLVARGVQRMNNINPMPKTKEPKVEKKEEVVKEKKMKKETTEEVATKEVITEKLITEEDLIIKNDKLPINKTTRKDILWIDPKLLIVEADFNTRFDYGNLTILRDSIIESGVREPLSGYKQGDNFVVVNGHRRHAAIVMAINKGHDIARVPFISGRKKSLEERMFDTILGNDGKQLTPLELGETYRRLILYGFTYAEIAKRIGRNANHISSMAKVAESSKELKTLITQRIVSASLVSELKKSIKDDEKAEKIIKEKVQEKKKAAEESGEEVKVTKKDLKNVIEKQPDNSKTPSMVDIDELEEKKKNVAKSVKEFTRQEVVVLLGQQIEACKAVLLEEFRVELDNVELVLKS